MDKAYATSAAFDRALKKAAKMTSQNPGEAYRQALRDRFISTKAMCKDLLMED